ncbi:hypothetical protein GGR50DRAFT_612235 [Xylaria sp. CBS 124048]|nr:hypothetical protein GGR50DRAFT_612235 [Xylaria sp. CBS 124048]
MVFSALSSTYQLYKQDTDSVAAWLASTAKSLGFTSTGLSSSSSSSGGNGAGGGGAGGGGGRLKGKARVQAKKQQAAAAASKSSSSSKPSGPKYIINIKDFVPLAEYLAEKAVSVPITVRATIDRVIAARSAFGDRLEKHGKAPTEISDAKHQYFIGVLERVREVLMPFVAADPVTTRNESPESDLTNRFACLAVYEPSQEFLDAPVLERPAKAENDNAVYEIEDETSFEHAVFSLTVVINDMNRVRSRIDGIWSSYKVGAIDLVAAAVATNTAIDLVRNMMEDILPQLKRHGGLRTMLRKFHVIQCLMKGKSVDEIYTGDKDNFNYDNYDIGYGAYLTVYRLLEGFIDVILPDQLPIYKEGMFGYYNPRSDRSKKTGYQKFEDDRALLMPFFSELVTASRGVLDWPIKDEFLRGMEELAKNREVPFYMVFAAQIFLDITYKLGESITAPFQTMMSHITTMDNDIKTHFEFHANLKINTWPAKNDKWMQELQRNIQWIQKDPLRASQVKSYRRVGVIMPEMEGHRIFRMSPVISGLFLYHFRTRYREAGLAVADVWGSIQYCEHLYNAVRQERLLDCVWPDMDIINANLGKHSFYVGGEVPKTPQDYFKKFCLQMGTSAAAMNGSKRKNTPLASKSGPRGLKEASPVLSMFKARYVENSGQVDWTPEHVSQIIELSMFEPEETLEDGTIRMGQIEDPEKLKEKRKLQMLKNQGRGRSAKSGNMPLEELIDPLVMALHAETIEYVYPYLNMHRLCWLVLRLVRDECDSLLQELYTPAYLERECQLPWMVGWIFMAAGGSPTGVSDRRLLQHAARAMRFFCDTGGSTYIIKECLEKQLGMPIVFEMEDESEDESSSRP